MLSKKTLFIIIGVLGIGIVILLVTGAYFLGKGGLGHSTSETSSDSNSQTENKNKTAKDTACATLTESEEKKIQGWKTYENSADGYSFKHPADLEVIPQDSAYVILTDDAALYSIQIGRLGEDLQSGYVVDSEENVTVACISTQKLLLKGEPPGGENFRRILTEFTKNGKKYSAFLTYRFVEESTSKELIGQYDLIIKTINFN